MAASFMVYLEQVPTFLVLALGFGFVIFWHELGHFLAAKWADVKVEQFAVGFGHALLSWRKGLGFRVGTSRIEYEKRAREYIEKHTITGDNRELDEAATDEQRITAAANALGLGETEYRLNWIPLGGYVKMLGQDDLRPDAAQNDPRAYNMKPIGKRMVIVSAGVVMNVILAIIGFAVLFRIGFTAPPPVVGSVQPLSPAQKAGIEVGDRIISIHGKRQHDFNKIAMNVLLLKEDTTVPVVVLRHDGTEKHLTVTPQRADTSASGFLQLGIGPSEELRGMQLPTNKRELRALEEIKKLDPPDTYLLQPDEKIIAINGETVPSPTPLPDGKTNGNYWFFDQKLQQSGGNPVELTIEGPQGQTRTARIRPSFVPPFGAPLNFAGLVPRATIAGLTPDSSAKGKLQPDDVVISLTVGPNSDTVYNPSFELFRKRLKQAGDQDAKVDLVVQRGDKQVAITGLEPNVKVASDQKGLGVKPGNEEDAAIVGDVLERSPAADAKIPYDSGHPGATVIAAVAGQPVKNWHDVQRILSSLPGPGDVTLTYRVGDDSGTKTVTLKLTDADLAAAKSNRYYASLAMHDQTEPRQTNNPLVAIQWGAEETWDLIVQFYQTLQRMIFTRTISYKQAMGPVGIFSAGVKFADRGNDWLIWFLSMISANLAVVNFLPLPIGVIDGGLFVFLIVEKIQGRPISPRVQNIAQMVGLALILSVFILVTIQDISRHF
jgi:regulator of sigma E protease